MARSHMKVYFDFEERTEMLTEAERGRLMLAMLHYAKTGEETELRGNERFLWPVFKADIDRDVRAYDAHVQAGQQGGRPGSQGEPNMGEENQTKPNETKGNQTKPNETKPNQNAQDRRKKTEEQEEDRTGVSHTGERTPLPVDARARSGGYVGPDGKRHPCRYDTAWRTSDRARGAVCQRVIDRITPGLDLHAAGNLHEYVMDALRSGVPPEWIEDAAQNITRATQLLAMLATRQGAAC